MRVKVRVQVRVRVRVRRPALALPQMAVSCISGSPVGKYVFLGEVIGQG